MLGYRGYEVINWLLRLIAKGRRHVRPWLRARGIDLLPPQQQLAPRQGDGHFTGSRDPGNPRAAPPAREQDLADHAQMADPRRPGGLHLRRLSRGCFGRFIASGIDPRADPGNQLVGVRRRGGDVLGVLCLFSARWPGGTFSAGWGIGCRWRRRAESGRFRSWRDICRG